MDSFLALGCCRSCANFPANSGANAVRSSQTRRGTLEVFATCKSSGHMLYLSLPRDKERANCEVYSDHRCLLNHGPLRTPHMVEPNKRQLSKSLGGERQSMMAHLLKVIHRDSVPSSLSSQNPHNMKVFIPGLAPLLVPQILAPKPDPVLSL